MKNALVIISMLISLMASSQGEPGRYNYFFAGAKAGMGSGMEYKFQFYNFMELTFGKIGNSHFSYQVKIGMDNYADGGTGSVFIGSASKGEISNSYHADGYFIKPGWILFKKLGPVYGNYISVNFTITSTKHLLEIKTSDPVYGNRIDSYVRNKFDPFSSIELEHCDILTIGGRVDFNVCYYLGYRILNPHLFNEILNGYGAKANFVPGVATGVFTFPVYFNVLFGINVHLY